MTRRDIGAALASSGVVALVGVLATFGLSGVLRMSASARTFTVETVPRSPIALVLGAQVFDSGAPSAFLAARLDVAVELYGAARVESVLVSGDDRAQHNRESSTMRAYLIDRGVPAEAILTDEHGSDTYDSCLRARDVFGVRQMIVVTQSYHLPRALVTARRLGIATSGVGDDSMRRYPRVWGRGTRREVQANVKMIIDLVSRRPPRHGWSTGSPSLSDGARDTR